MAEYVPKCGFPRFSGLVTEDVSEFLEQAMSYFEEEDVKYMNQLPVLISMLSGNAMSYYQKMSKFCFNVDDLIIFLKKRYTGHLYELQIVREFFQNPQRLDEKCSDFINRKMELFKRLPPAHHRTDVLELLRGQFRPANPLWSLNPRIKSVKDLMVAAYCMETQKPPPMPRKKCRCFMLNDKNCPLNMRTVIRRPIPFIKNVREVKGAKPKAPQPPRTRSAVRKQRLESIPEVIEDPIAACGESMKNLSLSRKFTKTIPIPKCHVCNERHFKEDCPAWLEFYMSIVSTKYTP